MSTTQHAHRGLLIACATAALIALGASAFFGVFGFTSVCARCGAIRDTTDWQIPMTSITIFHHSTEHASPVSTVLTTSGIIGQHEHQWLFCHGAGNGATCAIGEGRHIRPVVQSEQVAAIITASQRFGELQFRDRLLHALFDSKTAEAVRGLGMSAPTNGFSDGSTFHGWLKEEEQTFNEMVAILQKR